MSTSPISSASLFQELQTFYQSRHADVQQLGQDLTAGNLTAAEQDFTTLQSLGQSGPFASGNVFDNNQRAQDFAAIGQALQSGDLNTAQQAFAQLESVKNGGDGANTVHVQGSGGGSGSGSIYQQLQAFYQQRTADLQQLGQDLTAGNLTNAQQDYNALLALGQTGPFRSGDTYHNGARESDLNAVGQALQSGDLTGAQQAFAQLESTFKNGQGGEQVLPVGQTLGTTVAPAIPTEIVLNLGNVPAGEAINISLSNPGSGEQIAITTTAGQTQSTSPTGPTTVSPLAATPAASATTGPELIFNLANAPSGEVININLSAPTNGTEQVAVSASNPQSQSPEQIALNLNLNTSQQILVNLFNASSTNGSSQSSLSTVA